MTKECYLNSIPQRAVILHRVWPDLGTKYKARCCCKALAILQKYISLMLRTQVQRIRTDPHSPNKFRVEGTLYNVPEFAKAFNCKKGAKVCRT